MKPTERRMATLAPHRQLSLDLAPQPRYDDDEFMVAASNRAAFEMIDAWPNWPDSVLTVIGAQGAGKSHLAAIWARRAKAVVVSPAAIRADAALGDYYGRNVLVEDAETIVDERGLFHLFNLVQESRACLLLTASKPPESWGLKVPDLLSRLRRAPLLQIEPPDDELIHAVLVKLLVDRQLVVDGKLVDYLAMRIDRSLDAARALVRALDEEALAQGRPITRSMAARILDRTEQESG